jgi:hypothetical protein
MSSIRKKRAKQRTGGSTPSATKIKGAANSSAVKEFQCFTTDNDQNPMTTGGEDLMMVDSEDDPIDDPSMVTEDEESYDIRFEEPYHSKSPKNEEAKIA